ncbi:hypothetical protein [Streptomyces sp. NPDC055099]
MRLPLTAAVTVLLLTGCVSVPTEQNSTPPLHHPAGHSVPLPTPPAPKPSPPVQPRGLEELAWIGPSPATSGKADRTPHRKQAARPDRPRRSAPTPWRARPASPRTYTPAVPRSTPRRWTPTTPRVPTGGGMRSVCRSAKAVSPGLADMCRRVGR